MNTFSATLSILVIIAAALLCLIRKTDGDEVMGKRIWEGKKDHGNRPYFVFIETHLEPGEQARPTPCGGVLIETDIVLSAAGCFKPYEKLTKVVVKVGNFKHTGRLVRGKKKEIEAVSVEVYNKTRYYEETSSSILPPDVAKLRLASAAVDKKDVLSRCNQTYWQKTEYESLLGNDFLTVGMGKTIDDMPKVLQSLNIRVTEGKYRCNRTKSSRFFDNIDRFCAIGFAWNSKFGKTNLKPNSGACEGDEGGPVIDTDSSSSAGPCLVGVINEGIKGPRTGEFNGLLTTCEGGILFTSIKNLDDWEQDKLFTDIFRKSLFPAPKKSVLPNFIKSAKNSALTKIEGPKQQYEYLKNKYYPTVKAIIKGKKQQIGQFLGNKKT